MTVACSRQTRKATGFLLHRRKIEHIKFLLLFNYLRHIHKGFEKFGERSAPSVDNEIRMWIESGPAPMNSPLEAIQGPLSVSELNRLAREALEARFPPLWVQGEISNFTRAPSGHLYFTLKDSGAQVRCTLWRTHARRLRLNPSNGMRIEARATVSLSEPRGDYQLKVETLREAGIGNLHEAFLRLKARLENEGLFDPASKRPLPLYPRALAIITSPQAAALREVQATLARRAPHLPLVVIPTPVQGEGAGARIAAALGHLHTLPVATRPDAVLLVRGGGSLEDLWAFSEEVVARAIRACAVPVIVGVGHETDFTIADFAADARAATPTAAAEHASAGFVDAAGRLAHLRIMLQRGLQRRIDTARQRLDRSALRLIHPRQRVERNRLALITLGQRLTRAIATRHTLTARKVDYLAQRLDAHRPDPSQLRRPLERLSRQLVHALQRQLAARHERLAALDAHLQHLSPDAVLARGYSITRDADGRILRSAAHVEAGAHLSIRLHQGEIEATVNSSQQSPDAAQ